MRNFYNLFSGRPAFGFTAIWICICMAGCSKDIGVASEQADQVEARKSSEPPQLMASQSTLVLLAGNASNTAVEFNWSAFRPGREEQYTIEAALSGLQFADAIDIAQTGQTRFSFTVAELNAKLRGLLIDHTVTRMDFRVRLSGNAAEKVYSRPIAIEISTYHPVVTYSESQIFRVPGNYEGWKTGIASTIVSEKGDGRYEGYLNFNHAESEFLMIRGMEWGQLSTYSDIGAGKFGFGGQTFRPLEGTGIYRFTANTDTHQWTLTRIKNWSLNGSATGHTDEEMSFDAMKQEWTITKVLDEGSFIFRANHSGSIVMGYNSDCAPGSPVYNGGAINIARAGKYRIVLSLLHAGNYYYAVQRMP